MENHAPTARCTHCHAVLPVDRFRVRFGRRDDRCDLCEHTAEVMTQFGKYVLRAAVMRGGVTEMIP